MALQQNKKLLASDLNPIFPDLEFDLDISTRLRTLDFPSPSAENHVFTFESFIGAGEGQKQDNIVIHLMKDPQPGDPVEDILDDDGNVVVYANEFSAPIPSVSQVRETPLPEGPVTINTFGELFDYSRRAIYLASKQLNPAWADAIEG
jgi:hypothetical protein